MRLQQYIKDYMTNWNIVAQNSKQFHEHTYNINEIFDKDVELEKPEWDGKYFTVRFKIDDRVYEFKAMESESGKFSILFYTFGPNIFDIKGSKEYIGDVFAAIKKALHMLLKHKKVDMFWFNSNETKLIRLYDNLLNRMCKEFKNYEFDSSYVYEGYKFWRFYKKRVRRQIRHLEVSIQ
jgi:hypothetical protein